MTDAVQQSEQLAPRESALADIDHQQGVVAHWQAEKAAAEAELASLQSRAGDEVLADAGAGVQLARDMQSLRDRIDIAARVIGAAEPKLHSARCAVLELDACWWDGEAKRRRERVAKHESRSAALLARLQDHDGRVFVPAEIPKDFQYGVGYNLGIDKGDILRKDARRAELRAIVLREVAAGRDPLVVLRLEMSVIDGTVHGVQPIDLYPAAVAGPDAVLPAPGHGGDWQGSPRHVLRTVPIQED